MTRKDQLTLAALILLFALPPVAAYSLYLSGFLPTGSANKGTLISPIISIVEDSHSDSLVATRQIADKEAFLGRWNMLIWHKRKHCDQDCQKNIYLMRQVQTALGKDSANMRRFLLLEGIEPDAQFENFLTDYPRLKLFTDNRELRHIFSQITEDFYQRIFLVDPWGNLMMYYPKDIDPKDLLSDLKRLILVNHNYVSREP